MDIPTLKGFLGNPCEGGGPTDLQAVTDWAEFAVRHADTFCYDASGKKPILGLHPVPAGLAWYRDAPLILIIN